MSDTTNNTTSHEGQPVNVGRLIYVDPNQYRRAQSGAELGPDYTDMCISFNLIVEIFKRTPVYNGSLENASTATKVISIAGTYGDMTSTKRNVSALEGAELDTRAVPDGQRKPQYLTTYYTDITYGQYGEKEMIEGLGITSIEISYESYVAPTVVIKFVDVRGSSIWGREEAIHDRDRLTADNIYGCFFTYPYPRFRLQVKGYYGQPVTMQLICSSFKGNFNATTGDFEATATFIGYRYAWLSDIPFAYLVAAPYCRYVGQEYFNQKKNDAAWQLTTLGGGTKEMIELHKYIQEISKHVVVPSSNVTSQDTQDTSAVLTQAESEGATALEQRKVALNSIKDSMDKLLKTAETNLFHGLDDKPLYADRDLIVWVDESNIYTIATQYRDQSLLNGFTALSNSVNTYNNSNPAARIEQCAVHNSSGTIFRIGAIELSGWVCSPIIYLTQHCTASGELITSDLQINGNVIDGVALTAEQVDGIRDAFMAKYGRLRLQPWSIGLNTVITPIMLCYLGLDATYKDVGSRLQEIDDSLDSLKRKVDDAVNATPTSTASIRVSVEKGHDILPVTPFLGNIVKILLAHVETFVHMIAECAQTVKDEQRTISQLGIQIGQTDMVNSGDPDPQVPPFPAVYTQGGEGQGTVNPDKGTWAWVGNLGHKFKEEELVNALMTALSSSAGSNSVPDKVPLPNYSPVLPTDILFATDGGNPYRLPMSKPTIADIMSYAIIRAFQAALFSGDAQSTSGQPSALLMLLARLDAYNTAMSNTSVKKEMFNVLNGADLSETALQIGTCADEANPYGIQSAGGNEQNTFAFEKAPNVASPEGGRHPLIKQSDDGSKLYYVHTARTSTPGSESQISFLPSRIDEWENYLSMSTTTSQVVMTQRDGNSRCDRENYIHDSSDDVDFAANFLVSCSDKCLLADASSDGNSKQSSYENPAMFGIVTDPAAVQMVEQLHAKYKGSDGTVSFQLPSDDVTESNMLATLGSAWRMDEKTDYAPYYEYSVLINNKVTDAANNEYDIETISSLTDTENHIRIDCDMFAFRTYTATCVAFSDGEVESNIDKAWVFSDVVRYSDDVGNNIFASSVYYKHNIGDSTTASEWRNHAKALLFLQSIALGMTSGTPSFLQSKSQQGCVEKVPYVYLLLLGGFLWRTNFLTRNPESKSEQCWFTNDANHALLRKTKEGNWGLWADSAKGDGWWQLFGGEFARDIDYHIRNRLMRLFDNFVKGEFEDIRKQCELIDPVEKKLLAADAFTTRVEELCKLERDYQSTGTTSDITIGNHNESMYNEVRTRFATSVGDFFATYIGCQCNTEANVLCLPWGNGGVGDTIKRLIVRKAIVVTGTSSRYTTQDSNSTCGLVSAPKACIAGYLKTYLETLKNVATGDTRIVRQNTITEAEGVPPDEGIRIGTYIYLKNFYDKWLMCNDESCFWVSELYPRFLIMDEYYRDIKSVIMVNCEKFLNDYKSCMRNGSLFTILDHTGKNCTCLFLSMPNFITMEGGEFRSQEQMMDAMANIFQPCAYNNQPPEDTTDYFIFIYNNNRSQHCTDQNDFRYDGFDIVSLDESGRLKLSDTAPSVLSVVNELADTYTMGNFTIPSFGVAYAKQNQGHFKNMRLSMDNPIVTAHSAAIIERITQLGSQSPSEVSFVGQDVYNVHSSYAYTVEIEAMGNMQIQQLMYFQLLNVPMFRGTYIITKVTHSLQPGEMTTRFVGTKLSKWMIPYNNEYWMYNQHLGDPNSGLYGNFCDTTTFTALSFPDAYEASPSLADRGKDLSYLGQTYKFDAATDYSDCDGILNSSNLNGKIPWIYRCLCDEIARHPDNTGEGGQKWKMKITSLRRKPKENQKQTDSDHFFGCAIDIKPFKKQSNGTWVKLRGAEAIEYAWKAFDIIFCLHQADVRQVIYEYYDNFKDLQSLHIGVRHAGRTNNNPEFFIATNSGHNRIVYGHATVNNDALFANYRNSTKRAYDKLTNKDEFRRLCKSYLTVSDTVLAEHFSTATPPTSITTSTCSNNQGAVAAGTAGYTGGYSGDNIFGLDALCSNNNCAQNKDRIVEELNRAGQETNLDVNLIMMLFCQESEWQAFIQSKRSSCYGLWQVGYSGMAGGAIGREIAPYWKRRGKPLDEADQELINTYFSSLNAFNTNYRKQDATTVLVQIRAFRIYYTYVLQKHFGDDRGKCITHSGLLHAINMAPEVAPRIIKSGDYSGAIYTRDKSGQNYSNQEEVDIDKDGRLTISDIIHWSHNIIQGHVKSDSDRAILRRYAP